MDWIKWKLGLQKYYKHIWEYSSGMVMTQYSKSEIDDGMYGIIPMDCSFKGGRYRQFPTLHRVVEVTRQEYMNDGLD